MLTHAACAGNFDTYVQTRADREQEQMKRYQWEQDQIAHMKVLRFIAAFDDGDASARSHVRSCRLLH